jgi:cob(I)alamin adenosyltransferase
MTISRLFTGKGDQGMTDLLGERVGKDDPRIEVIGSLDEATSAIGLARAHSTSERVRPVLVDVQRDLYKIMAELAFRDDLRPAAYTLDGKRVAWLDGETDGFTAAVALPAAFILPGDSVAGAALDVARTVVRRAERQLVRLEAGGHPTNPELLRYLNRLSSLLFVLARFEDMMAGVEPRRARST